MTVHDAPTDRPTVGHLHVEHVMGTAVSFDLRDATPPAEGLHEAVAWLHHVDETFSPYLEDSPISRLGRGELDPYDASQEVTDVLLLGQDLAEDTDGAFDVFSVPAPNGTMLDPCGLVKGWSIERAAEILTRRGHTDFTINAGGDIALRGNALAGVPWQVGIRHPDDADRLAAVLEVTGPMGVATSATYERGAHIVDPRSGRPVTDVASVTVVGPDLTFADAYATTVFVMGLDGLEWLARHPGYEGFAITHDDRTVRTAGFARWLTDARPTPGSRRS